MQEGRVKKCVLILLDGIGDRAVDTFGNKTPLQAAHTPTLDRVATLGSNGLYHAARLGQALPSENAHFAIFGFDAGDFPGRGALEALGAGVDITLKDVSILAHVACLKEDNGILLLEQDKPAAGSDEIQALIAAVSRYERQSIQIRFHQTKGLFGVVVLSGDVSPYITDTNPMREGRPLMEVKAWEKYAGDAKSLRSASALKAYLVWAYDQLCEHPVNKARSSSGLSPINGLVTQRAGQLKTLSPFRQRYGMKGLSIASGFVYAGMSSYLGLDFMRVDDSNDPETDMAQRLALARHAVADYDFIHVHTKTPDEAAHTKDARKKKAVIEALDRGIAREIEPLLNDPGVVVVLTADHSTPSTGVLIHSGEAVPLTICGDGVRRDMVKHFDEVHAAAGSLGSVREKELMYLILNYLDRAKLVGIMDTQRDQAYWPGDYEAFSLGRKPSS
jgi:2,3-bisphosphoglycerate-independent phosphoglycerate mutase